MKTCFGVLVLAFFSISNVSAVYAKDIKINKRNIKRLQPLQDEYVCVRHKRRTPRLAVVKNENLEIKNAADLQLGDYFQRAQNLDVPSAVGSSVLTYSSARELEYFFILSLAITQDPSAVKTVLDLRDLTNLFGPFTFTEDELAVTNDEDLLQQELLLKVNQAALQAIQRSQLEAILDAQCKAPVQ